eukprot:gene15594-17167_t
MSLITVQIGQCGNQIGTELFELLSKDAQEAPQYADPFSRQNQEYRQQVLDRFFTTRNGDSRNNNLYFAKSILVDTEPKENGVLMTAIFVVKNKDLETIGHMDIKDLAWKQMLITDAALEEGMNWEVKVPTSSVYKTISTSKRERGCFNKSLANSIVVRGKDLQDVSLSDFSDKKIYSGHLSENGMLTVWNQERPFNNYEKSATLVSNSQSFVKPLNHVIQRAWNMFAGRAYVHQYNKYGLTDNDFIDSFGYVEQILADYESL